MQMTTTETNFARVSAISLKTIFGWQQTLVDPLREKREWWEEAMHTRFNQKVMSILRINTQGEEICIPCNRKKKSWCRQRQP